MKTQEQVQNESEPLFPPPNSREYFLKICRDDIKRFRDLEYFLDWLDTQIEFLPEVIADDLHEDPMTLRTIDSIAFISKEIRISLDGYIDRTLGSLGDLERGKHIWE